MGAVQVPDRGVSQMDVLTGLDSGRCPSRGAGPAGELALQAQHCQPWLSYQGGWDWLRPAPRARLPQGSPCPIVQKFLCAPSVL